MRKINELSLAERPRELLLKKGATAISLSDLWAVFLGSGNSKADVRKIASSLASFGPEINIISLRELKEIPGVGTKKALSVIAVREIFKRLNLEQTNKAKLKVINSEIAAKLFIKLASRKKEYIQAAYLDAHKHLLRLNTLSIGTLNTSIIHPRDVFIDAISANSAYVVLAHNHPSGFLKSSKEDLRVTKDLIAAGKLLGIPLIDHLIIAGNQWRSIINGKTGNIL